MKTKKYKYFLLGLFIGVLFSLTTYSFAADISAKMWKVGVFLNGTTLKETSNAIFSEGDIYLPAKYFSDVFNMSYSYSDKTGMLTLNNRVQQNSASSLITPIPTQPPLISASIPDNITDLMKQYDNLYIVGNDPDKTYLGKLIKSKYDSDGVLYKYGNYGSEYSSNSIWNKYGDFGSKYSSYSAFNKTASKPPIIYDKDGNKLGVLTINKSLPNAVDPSGLIVLRED